MEPSTSMYIPQSSQTKSYATVTSNNSFPKKDQAVVVESLEGVTLKEYILTLTTLVNPSAIRFISRIANSRICIYFDSKKTADELLDKQIKIQGKTITILPLITRNKRIVLSNVCPVIPHNVIEDILFKELNIKIKSPITFMKVGISEPGFSHILSFRRQFYIAPEDVKSLPDSFQVNYEDTNYWLYVTTDALKCFTCNNMGHLAKHCQQNKTESSQPTELEKTYSTKSPLINKEILTPSLSFDIQDNSHTTTKEKGIKRLHSPTTTESTTIDFLPPTKPKDSDYNVVEYETDTSCSNYSMESTEETKDTTNKKKKKKIKTKDSRNEEEIWDEIRKEVTEKELLPLNIDQFISLLDTIQGKHNIKDLIDEYTKNYKGLIEMCNRLHPKLNRSLKNRCSRLIKKLNDIINLAALTPSWGKTSEE